MEGAWFPKAQRQDLVESGGTRWKRARSLSKEASQQWAEAGGCPFGSKWVGGWEVGRAKDGEL